MNYSRLHKRFVVDSRDVYGMMRSARELTLLDVSVGGVSFLVNRRLELDRKCSLKLEYDDKVMTLDGVVIWAFLRELRPGPHGTIPFYAVGIKFTDCMNERMSDLVNFIRNHSTEKLPNLSFLKQTAKVFDGTTDKTLLDDTDVFKLRKLNLDSMVVESTCAVEINKEISLEIGLPGDKPLMLIGRVIFCFMSMNASRNRYRIGIEIVYMSMEDRKSLLKMISSHYTKHTRVWDVNLRNISL